MMAGAWCLRQDMRGLGVSLWVLAWVIVVWVVIADIMDRRARYLDSMAEVLNASAKNDADKIAALGFTSQNIPESVKVEIRDNRDGANNSKYFELPVSPVRLAPVARAVLEGQPFSERRWTGLGGKLSSNEFRRLRDVMRQKKLIEPISEKDPRQGYRLTSSGLDVFRSLIT